MADMLNIEKLLGMLKQTRPELAQFGVGRIGVFGSFARGSQTDTSDIDLLELVTPESLSPYLKEQVLQETNYVEVA